MPVIINILAVLLFPIGIYLVIKFPPMDPLPHKPRKPRE